MIISKIGNSLTNQQREDIAGGLVAGLVAGLAGGLVFGLAGGLVAGLVAGLAGGLVFGLAVGLASGLAVGLAYGVLSPLWLFIPAILILAEILFFFDRGRLPAGKNKYIFTLERKAEAIFETLLVVVNMMNIYVLTKNIDFYAILMSNCRLIATMLFWLGVLSVGVIGLAVWVWLNSLKYSQKEKKRTRSEIMSENMKKY